MKNLDAMKIVRSSAAPADANESVIVAVDSVTMHSGGQEAVRELLDFITQ